MAISMTTPHSLATQPGCGPDHLFTIRHYNKRAYMTLLLNSHFVLACSIPVAILFTLSRLASGGPLVAKQTIHGSYTWSGGTCHTQSGPPFLVPPVQICRNIWNPQIVYFNFVEIFGPPGTKFSDIFGPL